MSDFIIIICTAFFNLKFIPYAEKYGPFLLKRKLQQLQMGDLIEINYGAYQHWAVYIGDNEVVHKTSNYWSSVPTEGRYNKFFHKSIIKRAALHDVVKDYPWKISNKLGHSLFSPEEIRKRALDRLGTTTYCPFSDNCEHFANECRYNYKYSFQVQAGLFWHDIIPKVFPLPSVFAGARMDKLSIFTLPPTD